MITDLINSGADVNKVITVCILAFIFGYCISNIIHKR